MVIPAVNIWTIMIRAWDAISYFSVMTDCIFIVKSSIASFSG